MDTTRVHDGRRPWPMRTAAIGGAALLTILALLSGRFSIEPVLEWWRSVQIIARPSDGMGSDSSTRRPLNGAVLVTPPAPTGNDSSISPTPRRLVLVDTRPGRNPREGTARLGVSSSSPQTYVAGAILANGARLREIYADHVVLEKDGRTARLGVKDAPADGKASTTDALLTVGGTPSAAAVAISTTTEPLTDYLRPSPVFDGSRLVGYQVYPGTHADTFAQLGLQGGDIITAVDGAAVIDAASTIDQLEGLAQGRAVTADIVRNGHLVTISMDGAVIAASRAALPVAAATAGQGSKNSK
jgi:hypothetical protein